MGRKPTGRTTTTITIRVSLDTYHRLLLRSMRKHQKISQYLRQWVENDLYRKKKP